MVGGWMRLAGRRALGASWLCAVCLGPGLALGATFAGRTDTPPVPQKGEYKWGEPKDWTPPTLEELQKMQWTDGWVSTNGQVAKDRYAQYKPTLTDEQALATKNTSKETNEQIHLTLSRIPKSPDEVDWDATINRRLGGAPETLNPILSSSKYEQDVTPMIGAGFMGFDHTMTPFADGDYVKKWLRAPIYDMVILRDDVTWEDGTPFTAYDVEFSYHVIMDERITVPAVRSGTDEMKWVKAYDAHTVVYFHKEPLATNVWNVNFPVIPKHVYSPGLVEDPTMRSSEWNVYWNNRPLSCGAYVLKEHQPHQMLLYERRDDWDKDKSGKQTHDKPYIKTVRYRIIEDDNAALLAFKKGDLDEMELRARQYAKETDDADFWAAGTKVSGEEWTYAFIGWNQKPIPDAPFFKDQRVRYAMSYAMDYKELLDKIYFGIYDPAGSHYHPGSPMHNPKAVPFQQDLDKAEALLDEAGWKDTDGDGIRDKMVDGKKVPFEFTLLSGVGGTGEQVATLLKQDLEGIGVKVDIKLLEWATFQQQLFEHKFQACTLAWGSGADPDTSKNIWQTVMYTKGRNYVGYSNPKVDELFEQGARELNRDKRMKIYQEIDLILHDDQPYTFLNYRRTLWAFGKRLRGYDFSPRDVMNYNPGFFSIWIPKAKS
jgi:peptide/nickel transport system substrate-binding protein